MCSRPIDHAHHSTLAFSTLTNQQQITILNNAPEIGNRRSMAAVSAPDVGDQPLARAGGNQYPATQCGFSEIGKRFNSHGSQRTQRRASFKSSSICCLRIGDAMNPNRV